MDVETWTIVFVIIQLALILLPKVPLLNFLLGVIGISYTGWLATNNILWTNAPYLIVVLGFVSVFCIVRGGFEMRKS